MNVVFGCIVWNIILTDHFDGPNTLSSVTAICHWQGKFPTVQVNSIQVYQNAKACAEIYLSN